MNLYSLDASDWLSASASDHRSSGRRTPASPGTDAGTAGACYRRSLTA